MIGQRGGRGVFSANDRCQQENLLAQLHGWGAGLRAPVDNLGEHWAYMVDDGRWPGT